jgi:hypothetical protein
MPPHVGLLLAPVAQIALVQSLTRCFEGLILAFVGVLGLVGGTLDFGRFCRNVLLLPSTTVQFVSADRLRGSVQTFTSCLLPPLPWPGSCWAKG